MDSADCVAYILYHFCDLVKMLSQRFPCRSKVIPVTRLDLTISSDAVRMANNRSHLLNASIVVVSNPAVSFEHLSMESTPLHHYFALYLWDLRFLPLVTKKKDCNNEKVFLCEACTYT